MPQRGPTLEVRKGPEAVEKTCLKLQEESDVTIRSTFESA
jgi:hypothetical protein